VDGANTAGDASKSQWKLVPGSSLDQFSIRRSPASETYNEDALFFIDGLIGNFAIATVDTGNGTSIPFTPLARLHVATESGNAVRGETASSSNGIAVCGIAYATTGTNYSVYGVTSSPGGRGVFGLASATTRSALAV
jgi:hypothetical protein